MTTTHDHARIADITLLIFIAVCALAPLLWRIGALK